MSPGKIAAQCGHAYLDTYLKAYNEDVEKCMEYKDKHHGIKITLEAKSLQKLEDIKAICDERNIPAVLIEDLGYTCFEGKTTKTVLGIGPIRKDELPELKRLSLLK